VPLFALLIVFVFVELVSPFRGLQLLKTPLPGIKALQNANVLVFGHLGSGKSTLTNAFSTLFREFGVAVDQITWNRPAAQAESTTKQLASVNLPGPNIAIWDSVGWTEQREKDGSRTVVGDYNVTFLDELLSGHYRVGYPLQPPFKRGGNFYVDKPAPEARFKVVVLTFPCDQIGYNPQTKSVTLGRDHEQSLNKINENLRLCPDVTNGRIRIVLALTKTDYLLSTSEIWRGSQLQHVNVTSTTDLNNWSTYPIFRTRVAQDITEHFRKKYGFSEIVFTRGYTDQQTRVPTFDALNTVALNIIASLCMSV